MSLLHLSAVNAATFSGVTENQLSRNGKRNNSLMKGFLMIFQKLTVFKNLKNQKLTVFKNLKNAVFEN